MRLELTRRSDLAIRALRLLADDGGRVKRSELAAQLETTPDFLARIMAPLVSAGWVQSLTGPTGGYAATASAGRVSVHDLIDAVEGIPEGAVCVLQGGDCNPDQACALHDAWTRARNALVAELKLSPVID